MTLMSGAMILKKRINKNRFFSKREGGRATRAWVALSGLLLYALPAYAKHVTFEGEVSAENPNFTHEIPGALRFTMTGSEVDYGKNVPKTYGFGMEIRDSYPAHDFNYIRFETPPLRFSSYPNDFYPGEYGSSSYELTANREFCFLADAKAYDKAMKAMDILYWPYTYKGNGDGTEYALNILTSFPTGSGKLTVLDAKIAGQDYRKYEGSRGYLPITYLKFRVDLDIPAKPDEERTNCFSDLVLGKRHHVKIR